VKNVAGYDISRLLAGSLGTLGLILQVSLKVLPRPSPAAPASSRSTRRARCACSTRARPAAAAGSQRLGRNVLTLRLSGAQAAVDSAIKSWVAPN
jgi:glycolate oxidase FAD binding subunit